MLGIIKKGGPGTTKGTTKGMKSPFSILNFFFKIEIGQLFLSDFCFFSFFFFYKKVTGRVSSALGSKTPF